MMPRPENEQVENVGPQEPMGTAVTEVDKLKNELKEARAQAEANLAGWQRAQADFINYKRRTEQEREETVKFATSELILKILPILDDFERAFAAIPAEETTSHWVQGIKLVERKLKALLESQGVCEINAVGQEFNPNLHEAVAQVEGKEGIVIQQIEKGYKLGDRVIRPAKVCVGRGEPEKNKEE